MHRYIASKLRYEGAEEGPTDTNTSAYVRRRKKKERIRRDRRLARLRGEETGPLLEPPPIETGRRGYIPSVGVVTGRYFDAVLSLGDAFRDRLDFVRLLIMLTHLVLHRNKKVPEAGYLPRPVPATMRMIAEVAGERDRHRNGNFSSGRYLESFSDFVRRESGGAVEVAFSGYKRGRHCRYLIRFIVPKWLVRAARENAKSGPDEPHVDLRTGLPVSDRATKARHEADAKRLIAEGEARGDKPEVALDLHVYLHGLPRQRFSALLKDDMLRRVLDFLEAEYADKPRTRLYTRDVIRAIQATPKPLYQTTERSVRLSPFGMGFVTLPSKVRQYWTLKLGDLLELDLANSQLSINANKWGVQSVIETLRDPGYSVWPDLIEHLGGDVEDIKARELYKPVKGALKVGMYGTNYGMGKRNLMQFGSDDSKDVEDHRSVVENVFGMPHREVGKLLLKHPVMAAMLEARDIQIERVMAAGGLTDCFGRWIKVEGRKIYQRRAAARSALAQAAQAEEMALLGPVIDAAIEEGDKVKLRTKNDKPGRPLWRIVLWQHDGFSLWLKEARHRDAVVERLQELVAEEACRRGIPTRLEVA